MGRQHIVVIEGGTRVSRVLTTTTNCCCWHIDNAKMISFIA